MQAFMRCFYNSCAISGFGLTIFFRPRPQDVIVNYEINILITVTEYEGLLTVLGSHVHSCCMCKSDLTSVGCLYVINVYDALRHVAGA